MPGSGRFCPGAAAGARAGAGRGTAAAAAWGRDGWGGEGEGKGERQEEGERERTALSTDRREPALPWLPSPAAVTAGNNEDREAGGLSIGEGREMEGTCHPRPAAPLPLPTRSCPAPAAGALRGWMLVRGGRSGFAGGMWEFEEMGKTAGSVSIQGSVLPRAPARERGSAWELRVRSAGHGTAPLTRAVPVAIYRAGLRYCPGAGRNTLLSPDFVCHLENEDEGGESLDLLCLAMCRFFF